MINLRSVMMALVLSITSYQSFAADYTVIATDNIQWGLLNPLRGDASPRAADLWGDRTTNSATGMLVKFKKGFSSPPHIHNVTYRGVVIKGLLHNDDPLATKMWLPVGSFWTQPAGENHITAAAGEENLIYLEIDSGPYLVRPADQAFDNGERPINLHETNVVWLNAKEATSIENSDSEIAYLWGSAEAANGSFLKLPPGFKGSVENSHGLKAVVVQGQGTYRWHKESQNTKLSPSSFFSSKINGSHVIHAVSEMIIYINSKGRFSVKQH